MRMAVSYISIILYIIMTLKNITYDLVYLSDHHTIVMQRFMIKNKMIILAWACGGEYALQKRTHDKLFGRNQFHIKLTETKDY